MAIDAPLSARPSVLPEPSRGARDDDYFAGEISYHFRVFLYVACIRDIFVIILFVI